MEGKWSSALRCVRDCVFREQAKVEGITGSGV